MIPFKFSLIRLYPIEGGNVVLSFHLFLTGNICYIKWGPSMEIDERCFTLSHISGEGLCFTCIDNAKKCVCREKRGYSLHIHLIRSEKYVG